MEHECRNNGMAHDHPTELYHKAATNDVGQISIEAEAKTDEKTNYTHGTIERLYAGTTSEKNHYK